MIDKRANPFVVDCDGISQFSIHRLGYLSNLPTKNSIYFTTRPIFDEFKGKTGFPDPWFYKTGIFDGKFNAVVGKGACGIVFSGKWCGIMAAFKFVDIGAQKFQENIQDSIHTLDQKLSEMTSIEVTKGSNILSFYGHYR